MCFSSPFFFVVCDFLFVKTTAKSTKSQQRHVQLPPQKKLAQLGKELRHFRDCFLVQRHSVTLLRDSLLAALMLCDLHNFHNFPLQKARCTSTCQQSVDYFRKSVCVGGTIARFHAENRVKDKHLNPLLLSLCQCKIGTSKSRILEDNDFPSVCRLLPLQCFSLVHSFQRTLAVPTTSELHECIIRSAKEQACLVECMCRCRCPFSLSLGQIFELCGKLAFSL